MCAGVRCFFLLAALLAAGVLGWVNVRGMPAAILKRRLPSAKAAGGSAKPPLVSAEASTAAVLKLPLSFTAEEVGSLLAALLAAGGLGWLNVRGMPNRG